MSSGSSVLSFESSARTKLIIIVDQKKILKICDVPGPGRGSSFEEIALLVKDKSRR